MARLGFRWLLPALVLVLPQSLSSSVPQTVSPRAPQQPLSFTDSKWIWASGSLTGADVGLRTKFQVTALGKALSGAEIIITAFDSMQLYVNGALAGGDNVRPRYASRFCVTLNPFFNVFAVRASFANATSADIPAMIATIFLTYMDGTTQTLVSNGLDWRAKQTPDFGFEQPFFNDLPWALAAEQGTIGQGPWDEVNIPNATSTSIISFDRNRWIWTDAIPKSGNIPAGQRAFRRRFVPQPGQVPASATVIITADAEYTLWVNNVPVGFGSGYKTADTWNINFTSGPPVIVFAVLVRNDAGTAGFMLGSEINFRPTNAPFGPPGCIAGTFVNTEERAGQWKSLINGTPPSGWQQVDFDDSSWPTVVTEGEFPKAQPWGDDVTIAPPTGAVNI